MNTNKITAAQLEALQTILKHGGNVVARMGKNRPGSVNKRTLARLEEMDLVTVRCNSIHCGPVRVDVTVTAVGCVAVHQAEQDAAYAALVQG